ncbi:MAG: protein kinase [Acidobacteriota bacterium]
MTEATPARIGPYRILRRLGGGGMGVVYDAAHDASGDRVALKTVRAPAEWLVAGIRREIRALMGLTHPGIVRILGEGVEGGAPWYVMELVPGTTLREHGSWARAARRTSAATGAGDDGPAAHRAAGNIGSTERLARTTARVDGAPASAAHIREAQAAAALGEGLGLMRCLCATLAYLHGEGLVHGDLKPDNVVVRPDGVPVVMDFGVATRFAGEIARESLHELSHGFGTLAYMAPEQIQGHPLDARTDLYALGCILYELVCGRTPFVGQTTREIASKHLHTRPTPPRQMVDGIPSELDELIVALLAKSPRDRIGHADVVAEVLASLGAAALPAGAPPPRSYLYRPGFSGRDGALADLERALARAKEGGLQLVLVGAESGAGKTRLLMALATSAHAQHVPVIRGGALPGAATPFSALRPFFLAIVDRCRERGREEVRRVLGRRAKVLAPYAELLDLPGASEDPDPASIPPDEARLRLFTALAQTVRDVADGRPLVLMLDDLHWADELTLDFLWFLCRSDFAKRMPVLVLGAYRSEERTPSLERLLATPRVQRLALAELPERAVADIAADMMASRPAPEALVSFLYRHSQGNPFFVAEYLRTAVGEGVLARDRAGRWRLIEGRDYQALALPSSLQDLVTRRLGRIDARASSLARAAAVLGREMTPDLLAAMTGLSHEETATLLAALVRHHVVEDTPGGRVGFVHDKVREACYAALTTEERATRHRAAAAALEAAGSDQWEALARHWQEGGDPGRACGYFPAPRGMPATARPRARRTSLPEYFVLAAPSAS